MKILSLLLLFFVYSSSPCSKTMLSADSTYKNIEELEVFNTLVLLMQEEMNEISKPGKKPLEGLMILWEEPRNGSEGDPNVEISVFRDRVSVDAFKNIRHETPQNQSFLAYGLLEMPRNFWAHQCNSTNRPLANLKAKFAGRSPVLATVRLCIDAQPQLDSISIDSSRGDQ